MCLCKKVNQYYLGSDPNYGKAIKVTAIKYKMPVIVLGRKAGYSSKKYINGKLQAY